MPCLTDRDIKELCEEIIEAASVADDIDGPWCPEDYNPEYQEGNQ